MQNLQIQIQNNVPLAPFTTFKIGGSAEYFIEVKTDQELIDALKWGKEKKLNITFLAGGSNVLVADEGVKGLVIKLSNTKLNIKGERVECGAGANLINVSRTANNNNLTGLEWAIEVPGSIGGAIYGNAGAYGHYISDVIETIKIFDIKKFEFQYFSKNDSQFSYKDSIFKKNKKILIWEVILKLKSGKFTQINNKVTKYMEKRRLSQPRLPSAGCIFKNMDFDDLKKHNVRLDSKILKKGINKNNKIGAAWLIDLAGLKGKKIGGAKVSLEHANFIVNTGHATSSDVSALIKEIKKDVKNKFNIKLLEEVQYLK